MLSKDDIFKAKDFEIKEIEVPEWGGSIFIKSMSGYARAKLVADVQNKIDLDKLQLRVLINCICDSEGKLLFSEADLQKLGTKNPEVLSMLEKECCKISGIGTEAEGTIEKN